MLNKIGKLTITVGIPASGKSNWAKEQSKINGTVVIERDTIRAIHHSPNFDLNLYKITKAKERDVTSRQHQFVTEQLLGGNDVIVSDTNLRAGTRTQWEKTASILGAEFFVKVFPTPLATCIKRNLKRNHSVPESVLIRMETKMRRYLGKYVQGDKDESDLQECVIFDIDGTLADMKGVRHPFEWEKVGLDNPITSVVNYYKMLASTTNTPIFIFSGRDGVCREQTLEWLYQQGINIHPDDVVLREAGDTRPDTVVKEEMFDMKIKNRYYVSHVVDDRKAVCQMYESMGIKVFNVGGFCADF